ncbi:nitrilase-related carbon-nitrogen hydrolase [Oligosphaera ethanolica]|uniref:Nitrilase n=1 Tax=Oligosphaera ethanolica TaxID=760260 RepID=A0AAE3VHQ9_9BACT|nr:nitrilase-related carbon-nitrogen hydrolase [Oligosphaera ethanolica]MDQ0290626.1 nitrilase [Oligosphaera ethanolica]
MMSDGMTFRLGLCQMNAVAEEDANIAAIRHSLSQFAADGCDLALLPEYAFCLGGRNAMRAAARDDSAWRELLGTLCREAGVAALFGGVVLRDGDKLYDRAYVISEQGAPLGCYDKMHLFPFRPEHPEAMIETEFFTPGLSLPQPVSHHGWRIGLSICFDLRFPELYVAQWPCDLLICPAAFAAHTGRVHWSVLLRSRAIENQSWVAGVGQGGANAATGLELYGHSAIYDPWGLPIAEVPHSRALNLVVSINKERLAQCRAALPMGRPEPGCGHCACGCH